MCFALGKQYAYLEPNRMTDSVSILLISLVDIPFRLIWNDLWGGRTYLHLKGVYISPFLSFTLVNLKVLTISIGSLFRLIRTYSPLGASVITNCEIHAKQSAHHDHAIHAVIYIEPFYVLNL